MSKRRAIPLGALCAALVREVLKIPHEHAKLMTAHQMLSLIARDHIIAKAHGGTDDHWNIDPISIIAHRIKTSEIDIPRIAKTKRLARRGPVVRECGEKRTPTGKWRKGRKLQSRNDLRRRPK
jgi:hypothetical protein